MLEKKIEIINSKTGLPIVQIEHEGKIIPIHSKYDPEKEAERILDTYKDKIEESDHILFYGMGLGYHIKLFFDRYPSKMASGYEPISAVFKECMANAQKIELPIDRFAYLFTEEHSEQTEQNLAEFSSNLSQKILLIVLPVYEKIAHKEFETFSSLFRSMIEGKRLNLYAESSFAKRWSLNALMNLNAIFNTPNILLADHNPFKEKPIVLVSAGPSLSEEIENLRYIKNKKLAYIFAVGSANKALIAQGIYPDAVLTYDPQAHNHAIFEEIIEQNIINIPMIFGSTVGYETIQKYKGPMFHFITSQDTISPYFFEKTLPTLYDSTSIAIVTLQLLYKLEVEKVILVGQNFAFKNNLFYSEEIARYDEEKKEMTDAAVQKKDLSDSYLVEDTLGGQVMTNKSFDQMRQEMEYYIEKYNISIVTNATKGGAAIKGTTYKPLEELITEELTKCVVNEEWYKEITKTSLSLNSKKIGDLQKGVSSFVNQYEAIINHFKTMSLSVHNMNQNQIQKNLEKFDDLFKKFTNNVLYSMVIRPITRVYFEKLQAGTRIIRLLAPTQEKAVRVIYTYTHYLNICQNVYKEVAPIIQSFVFPALLPHTDWKEYISTSGVFYYEGEWGKQLYDSAEEDTEKIEEVEKKEDGQEQEIEEKDKKEDKVSIRMLSVETKQKNAKFKFRFSGTKLALYGKNQSDETIKLRIMVDNKITTLKIEKSVDEDFYGVLLRKEFYKTTILKPGMHQVTIEVLSENPNFLFHAAEIEKNERAYHIHEVTSISELEVGKRMRCHYTASYDTVGEFTGLGNESGNHLPVEASAEPDGDFYFIMVDDARGEKKLIADRNIQNCISWSTLYKSGIISRKVFFSKYPNIQIGLMTGGSLSNTDTDNDWDNYIKGKDLLFFIQHLSWQNEHLACHPITKALHILLRGNYEEKDISDYKSIGTESNVLDTIGFLPLAIILD
ncbi:6-hydroxymethylpterin diphosphokinase MptE-like protein [Domibacillus enclensis]|uniref:Uncharacterized conserved protein n=1 Tax=Domibacillus enclensis TaxID=1017273 RepID=A0A1N6SAY2_9BACI|nr:6-hydroxymethylpterin diphosphokinase MptE-like protein [Domibacillus enclensis]OXS79268.1 hypothetical protein B1B05_05720 [Domibacillus enclensis]SIQ38211.1 Uncharacterized conserved protein [Domibacillus enclensis]